MVVKWLICVLYGLKFPQIWLKSGLFGLLTLAEKWLVLAFDCGGKVASFGIVLIDLVCSCLLLSRKNLATVFLNTG